MVSKEHPAVLIVDDEKTIRNIICRTLKKSGCECIEAPDGAEALRLANKHAFDIVLTDLKMPNMGGLALIEWLRRTHPSLPIIIMTGYADVQSARKALRMHVSDYLVKPFESLAEVQVAVARAIEGASARADTDVLVTEFQRRAHEFKEKERELSTNLEKARLDMEELSAKLKGLSSEASSQSEQVEALIANIGEGLVVVDGHGMVIGMNEEIRRRLSVPGAAGTGTALYRLPGEPELREVLIEVYERTRIGNLKPMYVEMYDASGRLHAYEVCSRKIMNGNENGNGNIMIIIRETRSNLASSPRAMAGRLPFDAD
ncbi:MAG: response regulator [Planctomycetota bacterium]